MSKVKYRGHYFPEELFAPALVCETTAAPAAQFNPDAALKEINPWVNMTAPTMQPKLKNLVIVSFVYDNKFYDYIFYWLSTFGFNCYVCCADGMIKPVDFSLPTAALKLLFRQACDFNAQVHLDQLASYYQVAKDSICILDSLILKKINDLTQETDWLHVVTKFSDREVKSIFTEIIKNEMSQEQILKLLSNLKNHPDLQEQLVKKLSSQIDNSSPLYVCLEALENHPDLQDQLLMRHSDKIEDFQDFIYCLHALTASPDWQDNLLKKHAHKIENGCQFVDCLAALQALPDWQEKLLKEHSHKIKTGYQLYACLNELETRPDWQERLLKEHGHKIKTGPQLVDCLAALQNLPDWQERLLKEHGHDIKTGYQLVDYLAALQNLPDWQERLLKEHGHKIKTGYQLTDCLAALQALPDLQNDLLIKHSHDIKTGDQLASCLMGFESFPHKQEQLLKEHHDKIKSGEQLSACLNALKTLPNSQDKLLTDYNGLINTGDIFASCLTALVAHPYKQVQLLEKHNDKIDSSSTLALCLKALKALPSGQYYLLKKNVHHQKGLYRELMHCLALYNFEDEFALFKFFYQYYVTPDISVNSLALDDFLNSSYLIGEPLLRAHFAEYATLSDFKDRLQHYCFIALGNISTRPLDSIQTAIYLYISIDNSIERDRVVIAIKQGYYPHLLYVEVTGEDKAALQDFVQVLSNYAPQLRQLLLPENCKEEIQTPINTKYTYSFTGTLPNSLTLTPPSYEECTDEKLTPQPSSSTAKSKYLYIATATIADFDFDPYVVSHYHNVQAGECLNSESVELYVRTGIYNPRHLEEDDCTQNFFMPTHDQLKLYDYPLLTEQELDFFKKSPITADHPFYYIKFKQTLQLGLNRLLSITADDSFEGIVSDNHDAKFTLYHCKHDRFYYIDWHETVPETLFYIVKAKTLEAQKQLYEDIPKSNLLREVIDTYRDPALGFAMYTADLDIIPQRKQFTSAVAWLTALYDSRQGSCRDRVAAVEYKLKSVLRRNGLQQPDDMLHVVVIDNNHVCLEIFHNNQWIIVNVGGSSNCEESYSLDSRAYEALTEKVNITNSATTPHLCPPPKLLFAPATKIKKDNSSSHPTLIALQQQLLQLKTPALLAQQDILNKLLDDDVIDSCLIVCSDGSLLKQYCLKYLCSKKYLSYVINTPQDLDFFQQLWINQTDDTVSIGNNALTNFFEAVAASNPILSPRIIIDWRYFSMKARTQFNSLLDPQKRIKGVTLLHTFKIVSLCDAVPDDDAFFFRHPQRYKLSPTLLARLKQALNPMPMSPPVLIDLLGLTDWQVQLFGPIVLQANKPVWKPSEHVGRLSTIERLQLINVPASEVHACQDYFLLARARGYCDYHGVTIPLKPHFTVTVDSVKLTPININVNIQRNVTAQFISDDIPVINSQLFDHIFSHKKIVDNCYHYQAGYLHLDTAVTLWITHELTLIQWYALFAKAQMLNVTLTLYLAPGIEEPPGLVQVNSEPITLPPMTLPGIEVVITTQSRAEAHLPPAGAIVFELEDLSYADLIGELTYQREGSDFRNFEYHSTDFIEFLRNGTPVVLRGNGSPALLESLAPLLAGQPFLLPNGEQLRSSSPLTLYLEKEIYNIKDHGLDYLGVEIATVTSQWQQLAAPIIYQETNENSDLTQYNPRAALFLDKRYQCTIAAIIKYPLIALTGPTGVGKTKLMQHLAAESPEGIFIHYDFETWINDTEHAYRVWFWDESNIHNLHLTFLEPLKLLKPGASCQLFYKGKVYTVTDKHRVVFAHNPVEYGGGRVQQRLFATADIPQLQLVSLPPHVIYENILKPIYETYVTSCPASRINEATFREQASFWIDQYLCRRRSECHYEQPIVRELEQYAISFLMQNETSYTRFLSKFLFFKPLKTHINDYVELTVTQRLRNVIGPFINQHKLQRFGAMNYAQSGLNGCYLEGNPGMGKSKLVRYLLGCYHYQNAEHYLSHTQPNYWMIDASLSFTEQQERILTAFERGDAIIVDEVNTTLDAGLERILNAVLSGVHPQTGEPAKIPGFMAFFTGNSIALSGRDALSPALRHRQQYLKVNDTLSLTDIKNVLSHATGEPITAIEAMADDLSQLMSQTNTRISLRILFNHAADWYTKIYCSPVEAIACLP